MAVRPSTTADPLVEAFTADGTVDYFSLDIGDNWGRVSYIQPGFYDEGEWAPLAGQRAHRHEPARGVRRAA